MTDYRLAVLLHHPIHYLAPLMREVAKDPQIDLSVFYCYDHGVSNRLDPELGVQYRWDIPLLSGYRYEFLRNWSPWNSTAPVKGVFNPGIWRAIRKGRFDALLVHGYMSPTIWLAVIAARLSGTKVLLRGESTLMYPRSAPVMFAKRLLLRVFFAAVDHFMTIGSKNAEFYRSYGIGDDRMILTPYSVDNESFFEQRRANPDLGRSARRQLGIDPSDPVILFVGKLLDRKRPGDLLSAYRAILMDHPRAALVFVGEGEQRSALEAEAARSGLTRVHFVGFKNRSEILEYYASANIFVLPSKHETFGLVVNEAMCFALPILASHLVGSTADLVQHGQNGFVFPAGDIVALAALLKQLLDRPESRQALGAESERIVRRWGYAECVVGFKTALRRAADSSAPRISTQKANA